MTQYSSFHAGELAMQFLAGEQDIAQRNSRMVHESIPANVLQFLSMQTLFWIGITDQHDRPWAFALSGSPGFIQPDDSGTLTIILSHRDSIPLQWRECFQVGKQIGCLAIEFTTRRRFRINGVIMAADADRVQIRVQQAYPNCPKYITQREVAADDLHAGFVQLNVGTIPDVMALDVLAHADTAFVASIGPTGVDISHRGGEAGFLQYDPSGTLTVPDYKGNSMFNTLGNFQVNPVGGLLVMDFAGQQCLQLTGAIKILTDIDIAECPTGGTRRYWQIQVKEWRLYQFNGLHATSKST